MCKSWSDTAASQDTPPAADTLQETASGVLGALGLPKAPNCLCPAPLCGAGIAMGGMAPLALGAVPPDTLADESWAEGVALPECWWLWGCPRGCWRGQAVAEAPHPLPSLAWGALACEPLPLLGGGTCPMGPRSPSAQRGNAVGDKSGALLLFGVVLPVASGSACFCGREQNSQRSCPCLLQHAWTHAHMCPSVLTSVGGG